MPRGPKGEKRPAVTVKVSHPNTRRKPVGMVAPAVSVIASAVSSTVIEGAADGGAHVAGREDGGAWGPRGIGVGATMSSRCLFAPVIRFRYSPFGPGRQSFDRLPEKISPKVGHDVHGRNAEVTGADRFTHRPQHSSRRRPS